MTKEFKALVSECVVKNVVFQGAVGSTFTVQELVHSTSLATLNKMWQAAKARYAKLNTDSLFETNSAQQSNRIQLEMDTLKAVFIHVKTKEEKNAKAAELRKQRKAKLDMLREAKAKKEVKDTKKMSMKEIDAEIAALEAL